MSVPNLLAALVLLIGVPLNIWVTLRLWLLYRSTPGVGEVLRERAVVATAVLLLIVVFGLIFVNNDLVPPPLTFDATKFFTRFAMLLVSIVPAAYWLWLYRRSS